MGQADGAPREYGRKTTEGLHPNERFVFRVGGGEEGEEAKGRGEHDGEYRPAITVNVGEYLRGLALLRQSGKGTRGTIDGRIANGKHGDHNNDVHNGVKAVDSSIVDGDHKWGCFSVGGGLSYESRLIVWDQETDEGQRDDVEEANTPEDLLHGGWKGFTRIGGLSCS